MLRNLARNLPKTEAEEIAMKEEGAVSYVDKLFKPVEGRLWEVFSNNKSLVSQRFGPTVFEVASLTVH